MERALGVETYPWWVDGERVYSIAFAPQSITFDVVGDRRVVRTTCTSRFGTPVAWSDAT